MTGADLAFYAALLATVVANGTLFGLGLVAIFFPRRAREAATAGPRVAVVRPFRGLDPDAEACHRTLLEQDYPNLEVVFATEDASDPGVPEAVRAAALAPTRARLLVGGAPDDVLSGKARNMIAGWQATTTPFVAFSDSDIALIPDAIGRCMVEFQRMGANGEHEDDPSVGGVFMACLFDAPGLWGRLATLTATADAHAFLAGSARLGQVPALQGGLMVVRRSAVERAGGIEMLSNAIGDDARLGARLRSAGYELRCAPGALLHRSPPEDLKSWVVRYHRWILCQRAELPLAFWAMFLFNPIALSLLALAVGLAEQRALPALLLLMANLVVRTTGSAVIDRWLLGPKGLRFGFWVLARPLADLFHLVICVAAVGVPVVVWRGHRYRIGLSGDIVAVDGPGPVAVPAISNP